MVDTIVRAEPSAIIYSLAETVKVINFKPYAYFEYPLTEIIKHYDEMNDDFCENLLNIPGLAAP